MAFQKSEKQHLKTIMALVDGVIVDANNGTPQSTSIQIMIGQGVEVGAGTTRPGV